LWFFYNNILIDGFLILISRRYLSQKFKHINNPLLRSFFKIKVTFDTIS